MSRPGFDFRGRQIAPFTRAEWRDDSRPTNHDSAREAILNRRILELLDALEAAEADLDAADTLLQVEALAELWERKARELHATAHDTGDMAAEWDADAHEHHARALRAVLLADHQAKANRARGTDTEESAE